MAPIVSSTEVARPAEEGFAYVINPTTMWEWQQGVVRGQLDGPTTHVGSRCTTIRKIGGREREVVTEPTSEGDQGTGSLANICQCGLPANGGGGCGLAVCLRHGSGGVVSLSPCSLTA